MKRKELRKKKSKVVVQILVFPDFYVKFRKSVFVYRVFVINQSLSDVYINWESISWISC